MSRDGPNRYPVDEAVTGDCLRTFIGDQDCNWRPDNATNQMPRMAHGARTHPGAIRRTRPVKTELSEAGRSSCLPWVNVSCGLLEFSGGGAGRGGQEGRPADLAGRL